MPWPAPGNYKQSVDPHIIAVAHVAGSKPFRGDGDPAQPVIIEREGRSSIVRACFDLDESDGPAAASDNIYLAAGYARAPREDPPAVEPQVPAGERFCSATAPFRGLKFHFERSRARA
jgi:hypothetical protein